MTDLTEKQIAEYADDTEIAGWLECYVDLALAQHERGDYINRSYRVALHAHALHLRDRAEIEGKDAALTEIREIYAGMEGPIVAETAPEAYYLRIIEQMYAAARQALQEGSE